MVGIVDQNDKEVRELKGLLFPWGLGSFKKGVDSNRKGLTDWENGGQGLYTGTIGKHAKGGSYCILVRRGKSGMLVFKALLSSTYS